MRATTPRASRSPTPRWPRLPSSVIRSMASGTTPSHPTSRRLEALISLGAQLALHALAGRQPLRHAPARRRHVAQLGALLAVLAGGDEQLAFHGLAGGIVL